MFPEPFPAHVKFAWSVGGALLIAYPALKVCQIPNNVFSLSY